MKFDYLFEVSSEAGRKIGGIYTVIKSKTEELVKTLENRYMLFGMYDIHSAEEEFIHEDAPSDIEGAFKQLKEQGIDCHWGRWKKGSNARLILIDAWKYGNEEIGNGNGVREKRISLIKNQLWKDYKIDSLFMGSDFDNNVMWAYAVGEVIKKILELERFKGQKVITHFHEWISGAGLLNLKSSKTKAGLVFTTHATSLGRTLASSGRDLIQEAISAEKEQRKIDDGEAYKFKLEGQHLLEKACAENANIFTTVSEITAKETKYILGKYPEVVTPNALNFKSYESVSVLKEKAFINREKINEFLRAYFLPFYETKVHNSPLIYLSGRYEVRDKGIDIFIDMLSKLNAELIRTKYDRNVFAFIFVPSNVKMPRSDLTNNLAVFKHIEREVNKTLAYLKEAAISNVLKGEGYSCDLSDSMYEVKNLVRSIEKTTTNPPTCCYELNYDKDRILTMLSEKGLTNKKEDIVKVIFYPTYVREKDGLLEMQYYDVINGMDIGIFPSRYEPWGYTPIEAGAFLNVAFTTDYAGYGRFIKNHAPDNPAIKVINMEGRKTEDIVNDLESSVELLINMDSDELQDLKIEARKIAEMSSWTEQIGKYYEAYERAAQSI